MKPRDARKLKRDQLTDLRGRGVAAVQSGEMPAMVAKVLGVGVSTVFGWLAKYRAGGWDALRARRRGGRRPKLDSVALKRLYDTITTKDPRQLQFPFALWTSRMVGELIERRFGIRLSKASVCRLLNQLGLSPQKPLWRAFQKDPARVQRWLSEEYPTIKAEAKKRGAVIYFGDEAGVRSDHHAGTTWAIKGKTPVVQTTGARFGLNLVSAVSPQGEMRFMTVQGTMKATVFVEFLKRLLHNADRPVFLIIDGHPAHRSGPVSKYVASTDGMLHLFFLPGYSPELNPDEQVWNDLKNNGLGRKVITGPKALRSEVLSLMRSLQRRPSRIRSFFMLPDTIYAAA
ncbi:MAG: IS630 family transposase [Desulfobacterales bacterium]|nr:IS630 family transposase [Desulfobacterales bacterium]